MKINAPNSLRESGAAKNAKRTGTATGNFAGLLDAMEPSESEPAPTVSATAAPDALMGMLSLQEVGEESTRRRAVAYSNDVLDRLEDIRHGLLTGTMPLQQLQNLSDILDRYEQFTTDPSLAALLEDIRLRAAVELAKLEMAGQ